MFGEWTYDINSLREKFINSGPVKYVVINNFFTEEWADRLHNDFPIPGKTNAPWKKLDDPVERRFIMWNYDDIQSVVDSVKEAHSPQFINYIEQITGFDKLIIDPNYQHATGLIAMPRGGKLGIHLDVNINRQSNTRRRCTMLIYLNKNWKDEYGGSLQIGESPALCKDVVAPAWNTAILVENSQISYHGVPVPLTCPEGEFRKNLGVYYSSIPTENTEIRYRAAWFTSLNETVTPELQTIYDIRNNRPITEDDLKEWPTWRQDTYKNL